MLDRLASYPQNWPAQVGKLRDDQVASRMTWGRVPDAKMAVAAMHVIHTAPIGSTTITAVNPLDPGTVADSQGHESTGWLRPPRSYGWVSRTYRP